MMSTWFWYKNQVRQWWAPMLGFYGWSFESRTVKSKTASKRKQSKLEYYITQTSLERTNELPPCVASSMLAFAQPRSWRPCSSASACFFRPPSHRLDEALITYKMEACTRPSSWRAIGWSPPHPWWPGEALNHAHSSKASYRRSRMTYSRWLYTYRLTGVR
jgi:hypothetical protein